jgi:hypothetical protein
VGRLAVTEGRLLPGGDQAADVAGADRGLVRVEPGVGGGVAELPPFEGLAFLDG